MWITVEMLCSARHQIKREMDFFTLALKILFLRLLLKIEKCKIKLEERR